MGSRGGNAPNAYRQREARTVFLRVPVADWARVRVGEKTEFRTRPSETSRVLTVPLPSPVVAYNVTQAAVYDAKLMVLEEHRHEPLFAIAEDHAALAREGFATYDEFRRYWRARRRGIYRPMEMVHVFRVRNWQHDDAAEQAARLLDRLYGDWL